MQAVSTAIRQERTQQAITEGMPAFLRRQRRAARLRTEILLRGQPEARPGSTGASTHFHLRHGEVDGHYAEAQVYRHPAGIVIRFWVWENFGVRVRDLVLLPAVHYSPADLGRETWLEADGRLFPHVGKYAERGLKMLAVSADRRVA